VRIINPDTVWVNKRAQEWLGTPSRWPRPIYTAVDRQLPEMEAADERLIAGVTKTEELVTEVKNLGQTVRHWRAPARCNCQSVFILIFFEPCGTCARLCLFVGWLLAHCLEV
jgi:hypothetical protein